MLFFYVLLPLTRPDDIVLLVHSPTHSMMHCNHPPRQQPSRSPILLYALLFLRTPVENADVIIAAVHASAVTVGSVLMIHLLWLPMFAQLGMPVTKDAMQRRTRILY